MFRGVLASRAGHRPRGIVGSGVWTGQEGVSVWDQAMWSRSNNRPGDRGGALAGKPRCVRILAITVGSSMAAMIFKVPPQWGHCSMSISNARLSSRAQLMRVGSEGGGASAWSAEVSWVVTGALGKPGPGNGPAWRPEDGMISRRSLALRPRRAQQATSLL